jgi:hypothetical protein
MLGATIATRQQFDEIGQEMHIRAEHNKKFSKSFLYSTKMGRYVFDILVCWWQKHSVCQLRRHPLVRPKRQNHQDIADAVNQHRQLIICISPHERGDPMYHMIAMRDGIVYDNLKKECCMLEAYRDRIDALFFVELKTSNIDQLDN